MWIAFIAVINVDFSSSYSHSFYFQTEEKLYQSSWTRRPSTVINYRVQGHSCADHVQFSDSQFIQFSGQPHFDTQAVKLTPGSGRHDTAQQTRDQAQQFWGLTPLDGHPSLYITTSNKARF